MKLTGKKALITGGKSGVGQESGWFSLVAFFSFSTAAELRLWLGSCTRSTLDLKDNMAMDCESHL